MPTYDPTKIGVPAPSGGFQQGGWYSGRQFFNGTLSDPGVIHPESSQQGAGQAVSQEVVKQTNPANVAYIQKQNPQAAPPINQPAGGTDMGGGAGMAGGVTTPPTIDLQALYTGFSDKAGISTIQKTINDKTASFNEAQAKINDNPYLSEANRVGRIQKLTMDFNNNIKNDHDALAMKQADVKLQLDLASKQYDINSQASKDALSQFNSLLSMGALDNASGTDIANLTKATGLSSSMIQSAIKTTRDKNTPTSTVSYDDGTHSGFAIINSKTGDIIKKQDVALSKPKVTTNNDKKAYYMEALRKDAAGGAKLNQIFSIYQGYLSPDEIYQLYNANSKYGPDKGDIKNLEKYGVKQPSGFQIPTQ